MLRPSALAATVFLAILATLLACQGTTPTPSPTETTVRSTVAATPALMPNTPGPKAMTSPAPTEIPTETPTATFTATPAISPTSEPTENPPLDGTLAPIQLQDSQALQSALSEGELACIGDVPETLDRVALAWPAQESKDELFRLIGCLSDETLARLFLAGLVTGPEPISPETSDCVRAVFAVIDPQEVMTAGIEDDPERAGRAMAASTAAATTVTACLTDEEWERATPGIERGPQERAEKRCMMEVLGGPGEMAETMRAAREGDSARLTEAAAACGLDRDPATGQGPAEPPTTSTVTVETLKMALSTPAPAPVITTIIRVAPVPPDIPEYDHSQWKHWGDADGDCASAEA